MFVRIVAAAALVAGVLGACGPGDDIGSAATTAATSAPTTATIGTGEVGPMATAAPDGRYPDIVEVEPSVDDEGNWSFAVTISSPYDSPDQYADGWRVVGPDGTVYGEHQLAHHHADEQPFTRYQLGVEIPPDVTSITVEGRDLINGYGGTALSLVLSSPSTSPATTGPTTTSP